MHILTTAIGLPVGRLRFLTNRRLSGYFKSDINRIISFLLLLQFLIFFNKKSIFGYFPTTQIFNLAISITN
jgi:hypothetical protein